MRDAPVQEIEAAIHGFTWPEQKAPRIQAILQEIANEKGNEMSLNFLADRLTQVALMGKRV